MSTAFRLKTYPEILSNMVSRARALLDEDVDLNPGSVLRTILEASSLQDADQYVQISRLLDLFSLDRADGDELDRRAIDFGSEIFTPLRRRPANTSVSKISVGDGTLAVKTTLTADAFVGATTFDVLDASTFPSAGAVTLDRGTEREEVVLYTRVGNTFTLTGSSTLTRGHAALAEVVRVGTRSLLTGIVLVGATTATITTGTGASWGATGNVIFERGTVREEKRAYTRAGDVLTFTATTFQHAAGTVVIQGTTGSDRTVAAGLICYVPATESSKQINFRVVTAGKLSDGDVFSDLVDVVSESPGADTRAGANTITKWSSAPFTNATVTNPVAATRGADREKSPAYRQRIRDFIQSLSRGTGLSITTLVNGLTDPVSNTTVAFAQIVEPVAPGASDLYITDGTTTFSLAQVPLIGRDVLIRDAEAGDRRGKLGQYGPFGYATSGNVTPRLFKSVQRGVATSVGVNYLEDTTQAMVVNAYAGMYLKTDDDQFYPIASNTAIRFVVTGGATPSSGSYSVYNLAGSPLTPGTDFAFNESTGDVELASGLALVEHDGLVAASDGASPSVGAYTYSTGLAAYVQRTVNGDPTDFTTFPGIKSVGTKVVVKVPTTISPTFTIKVIPARGFTDLQVADSVKVAVQTYVNSRGIGENVVLSEIIRLVKELPGIDDVAMIDPISNLTVPFGQLVRITDDNVELV